MNISFSSNNQRKNSLNEIRNSKNKSETQKKKSTLDLPLKFRLILVWLVILLGISGLGWRLYQLQITNGAELKQKAKEQQTTNFYPYIPRRSIVDIEGNVVATDKVVYSVYAHPIIFTKDREEVAKKLAPILNKSAVELLEQFKSQDTGILLAKTLNEEDGNKIKALSLDGLETIQRYTRFYPQDNLIADILGYVNLDHIGQAGIEYSHEKSLKRELPVLQVKRAGNGAIIPANLPEDIVELDDSQLQLTIDLRLQRAVRTALEAQIQKFKAKRGAVIVLDATDGSILALACEPTYNPNRYFNYDLELFKNWTITDAYEPGSTFKPINVAIALDEGVITPNTHIYDGGNIMVDGWPISNASKTGNGNINITQILETSSNVGMIKIIEKMSRVKYYEHLQNLGLGKTMGVDLPFEASGYMKSKEIFTARAIEPAVTSFGQGFSLTPLKLVQLHAALANGGKLVTPHVVRGLVDSEGNLVKTLYNKETPTVFSQKSSHSVVKMMESVVANGTGEPAKIEGYRIGGKTGTAQKAGKRGGYLAGAKITSFVAIMPVSSPRYVILAVVDEPQGGNTFGSTVAAPIVKEVMKSLISIKGIPPS
jgi:cell division protein FtsI (penicillin-binding protein 3)